MASKASDIKGFSETGAQLKKELAWKKVVELSRWICNVGHYKNSCMASEAKLNFKDER